MHDEGRVLKGPLWVEANGTLRSLDIGSLHSVTCSLVDLEETRCSPTPSVHCGLQTTGLVHMAGVDCSFYKGTRLIYVLFLFEVSV